MVCWSNDSNSLEQFNCAPVNANSSWEMRVSCAYGVYHKTVASVVSAIGVLCNIAIILVLLRANMRKSSVNILLTAIAICDMLLMASNFIYLRVDNCHLLAFSYEWQLYTLIYANLSVCTHALSLCLTVLMAMLRYIIIRSKGHSTFIGSTNSSLCGVLVCTIAVLAGFSINFFRNEIAFLDKMKMPYEDLCPNYAEEDRVMVDVYLMAPRSIYNCTFEKINYWLTGVLFKVLPCALLTVFMSLLVKQILEARSRAVRLKGTASDNSKGDRTTVMLVSIIAICLLTELPQGALMIIAGITPKGDYFYGVVGDFLDLLSLINSSVNFVLYVGMSTQFRQEFVQVFGMSMCRQWTRTTLTNCIPSCCTKQDTDTTTTTLHQPSTKHNSQHQLVITHNTVPLLSDNQPIDEQLL